MTIGKRAIISAVGLSVANYVFQYFGDQNWNLALDRSWFQATALLIFWSMLPRDERNG